jgi:dihydroflavonol-4-reductase
MSASSSLVLVTGASGFVGSAVVRRLLASGHAVRVLVRPTSDRRNVAGLPCEVVVGDLRDANSVAAAVRGCRHVFHVAAEYRLWHPRPRELYATNVEGTRALARAARAAGVERFVYTSSVATLGLRAGGEPADEETPVRLEDMIGHYKRSKFLAEEEVLRLAREEGLPAVIVNPSAPIGPRDARPTPTGRMVLDAAAGRMPAYVDTGLNVVHVDDVAEGHLLALERGVVGERYVLGGEDMSLRRILAELADIVGRRPPRMRLAPGLLLPLAHVAQGWARVTRGSEPRMTVDGLRMAKKRMYFMSDKARRELGYAPRPARRALEDAVAWFAEAGHLPRGRAGAGAPGAGA